MPQSALLADVERLGALEDRLAAQTRSGRPVLGVFTDVDDTLTDHHGLMPPAREALAALAAAGMAVVAVTGRPVGWSERFLVGPDPWPVVAILAENGAVALVPDGPRPATAAAAAAAPALRKRYQASALDRAVHAQRLHAALEDIERRHPGARRASDSAGRETDIAIDHSEHTQLDGQRVARITQELREQGFTATVSSIHINAWLGEHHKAQAARWFVREHWGRELDDERDRWVVVGDSTNDQPLFEQFIHTVGVANIERFWPELAHRPRYVARAPRGEGFAELAAVLLRARRPG